MPGATISTAGSDAIAAPETFPDLDKAALGLKPLDCEVWEGFVFVRFHGAGPSLAEAMAPHAEEAAPYRLSDLVPDGDYWQQEAAFNWKVAMDIDNEGYHVPNGHPMLMQLYGPSYYDDFSEPGPGRSFGEFRAADARQLWSVRHYLKLLPEADHLPESHRRAWLYYGVFPSCSLGLYPDSVEFYQVLPIDAGRSLMRGRRYALPDGRRETRAARYLNGRINWKTAEEDYALMALFAEGLRSPAFDGLILSDLEYGVRAFHDQLRALLPVLTLPAPPPAGRLAEVNAELSGA